MEEEQFTYKIIPTPPLSASADVQTAEKHLENIFAYTPFPTGPATSHASYIYDPSTGGNDLPLPFDSTLFPVSPPNSPLNSPPVYHPSNENNQTFYYNNNLGNSNENGFISNYHIPNYQSEASCALPHDPSQAFANNPVSPNFPVNYHSSSLQNMLPPIKYPVPPPKLAAPVLEEKIAVKKCKKTTTTKKTAEKKPVDPAELKNYFHCSHEGCGKYFKRQEHLTRHFRMHSGEQPFQCDHPQCLKRFSRNDNLLAHKRIHAKKLAQAEEYIKQANVSLSYPIQELKKSPKNPPFYPSNPSALKNTYRSRASSISSNASSTASSISNASAISSVGRSRASSFVSSHPGVSRSRAVTLTSNHPYLINNGGMMRARSYSSPAEAPFDLGLAELNLGTLVSGEQLQPQLQPQQQKLQHPFDINDALYNSNNFQADPNNGLKFF